MKWTICFFTLLIAGMSALGQSKIKGIILDEIGPLQGASILINNSDKGTISNIDGRYKLEVESEDTLSISYVGYKTIDVVVGNQKEINLVLERGVELDEVIVIGYGRNICKSWCYGVVRTIYTSDLKPRIIKQALYPNPSREGQFSLNLLEAYKNVEVQISNMSGQIISKRIYYNISGNLDIDLSNQPSGMYILNIIADGKELPFKKAIIG